MTAKTSSPQRIEGFCLRRPVRHCLLVEINNRQTRALSQTTSLVNQKAFSPAAFDKVRRASRMPKCAFRNFHFSGDDMSLNAKLRYSMRCYQLFTFRYVAIQFRAACLHKFRAKALIFAAFLSLSVLPPTTSTSRATKLEDICRVIDEEESSSMSSTSTNSSSQPSRRLIKADFALFKVSSSEFRFRKSSTRTSCRHSQRTKNTNLQFEKLSRRVAVFSRETSICVVQKCFVFPRSTWKLVGCL